jgi:branched-chain amino acid transport system ATP-binding protein
MLRVTDLHVHIGKLHILQGVSLDVGSGEAVALLGRNGVGKTTTLRAILALAKKSAGSVELDGKDLHALPAHRIPSSGIGYVPQGRGIFPNLTVRENLFIGLRGKPDREFEERELSRFPRLLERARQRAGTLSGGEQQMLALARCLMMRPRLVILDEPTEGIMPRLVSEIRREIHRINASGVSVLLVEQNVKTALKLCQRVFVMEKGAVVYAGSSHDLKARPEVLHRHLGVSL